MSHCRHEKKEFCSAVGPRATGAIGAPIWASLAKRAQPRHLLAAGMLLQAEIWDVDNDK
jgi:hypothetical protein